jgi:hypothetical protein
MAKSGTQTAPVVRMAVAGYNKLHVVQLGYYDFSEPNEHLDLIIGPQTLVSLPQARARWCRFVVCFKCGTERICIHALEFRYALDVVFRHTILISRARPQAPSRLSFMSDEIVCAVVSV